MKRPTIRPRATAFCCDCGERMTDENRHPMGGPRCAGCRALKRPRPGLLPALALTVAGAAGFGLGRAAAPGPPAAAPPVVTRVPAASAEAQPPPPPEEPLHPCGARTKRGTLCKRLVRGEGHCWQHGGKAPENGTRRAG